MISGDTGTFAIMLLYSLACRHLKDPESYFLPSVVTHNSIMTLERFCSSGKMFEISKGRLFVRT